MNEPRKKTILPPIKTKRYGHYVFLFSCLLCLFWSIAPALKTGIASSAYILSNDSKPDEFLSALSIQRKIQKHFLSYGLYIPIDDIVVNMGLKKLDNYSQLHESTCGSAKIYIWLPIKIRLPVFGEKVWEWCLKHD